MYKIKQQIDQLKNQLNSTGISSQDQVVALQEGLAEERDALYNVEQFLNLPFNLTPCNSTSLSKQQRDSLRNQSNSVANSLEQLKAEIVECRNCTTTVEMSL